MHRLNGFKSHCGTLFYCSRHMLSTTLVTTCRNRSTFLALNSYSAVFRSSCPRPITFLRRQRLPAVLQSLNFSQQSSLKRIRKSIPDELWAIIILGKNADEKLLYIPLKTSFRMAFNLNILFFLMQISRSNLVVMGKIQKNI